MNKIYISQKVLGIGDIADRKSTVIFAIDHIKKEADMVVYEQNMGFCYTSFKVGFGFCNFML